ncbi:MAG: 4'-phosphopantetheinyl transferase superfamily protein [Chitinophagaceae bacterium]
MPIFFQHQPDAHTRMGIWKIEEDEEFFSARVQLQRSITHPRKRLQHLAGRYLLTYLFPGFPLHLILIADTRKPFLEDEAFHFSISHCGAFAAVIVSTTHRVGIDIEIPTPKPLLILHKFLHPEENSLLLSNEQSDHTSAATLLWSAKESMFKWWGRGKVDFSEMLRLSGSVNGLSGALDGHFKNELLSMTFPVQFQVFPDLVLTWITTR